MEKTKEVLRLDFLFLLFLSLIVLYGCSTTNTQKVLTPSTISQVDRAEILSVKGKVKSISRKAKAISVSVKGKGIMFFKFNETTKLENVKSIKDIKSGEAVVIRYKEVGTDRVAVSIKKAFVKLPKGVKEIKTAELFALISSGKGNYLLIDARPSKKYAESHIPTAISIPVSRLKKEGAKLLPSDKNSLLIFYCGGPT